MAIEKSENQEFEAFFYIFGYFLGISVAIGDIEYFFKRNIDIWQLKKPKKHPNFAILKLKFDIWQFLEKKKKKKKKILENPHEA